MAYIYDVRKDIIFLRTYNSKYPDLLKPYSLDMTPIKTYYDLSYESTSIGHYCVIAPLLTQSNQDSIVVLKSHIHLKIIFHFSMDFSVNNYFIFAG